MRSCAAAIGCATLLAIVLAVGWVLREDITRFAGQVVPGVEAPAEAVESGGRELARRVESRVVALGQGEIEEAVLSEDEVNAWIEHGLRGFFPEYLSDVAADLRGGELELSGRVAVREVPGIERLGMMVAFLGDTAELSAGGTLDGRGPGRGVFHVDVVHVGAVPLPDPMRDQLLMAVRGRVEDGVAGNAISFPLPEFVTDVAVREGELVMRGVKSVRR